MTATPTSRSIPRRGLAKGAAWTAPVVAVGALASASAASPPNEPNITFQKAVWARRDDPGSGCNTYNLSIYRTSTAAPSTNVYLRWANTSTATQISNVSFTAYFPFNNMTWATQSGHNACWTLIARDASIPNATHPTTGTTLFAYTTTYTCAITAVNGTTSLPKFDFRTSSCYNSSSSWRSDWGYTVNYRLNGVNKTETLYGQLG